MFHPLEPPDGARAGSAGSTATTSSTSPRRRCRRSSAAAARRASTPSTRSTASPAGTRPASAGGTPLRRPALVRVRESGGDRRNRAQVASPGDGSAGLVLHARLAAVMGSDGAIGGYSVFAEWRDPQRPEPEDRDFAFGLGPVVLTAETSVRVSSKASFDSVRPRRCERRSHPSTGSRPWSRSDGTVLLPGGPPRRPGLRPLAVPFRRRWSTSRSPGSARSARFRSPV